MVNVCERLYGNIHYKAYTSWVEGRVSTSIVKYMVASFLGYDHAQLNVATILMDHCRSADSYKRAFSYLKRSSNQDDPDSSLLLGDIYYYGQSPISAKPDYETAIEYYRKAEEKKSAQASFNIGYCYENGLGAPQNYQLAKKFYQISLQYDPLASVPVYLALLQLFVKEWWKNGKPAGSTKTAAPKVDIPVDTKSSGGSAKSGPRFYEKLSHWKKTFHTNAKRIWAWTQKILLAVVAIIAAYYYVNNFFRLFGGQRRQGHQQGRATQHTSNNSGASRTKIINQGAGTSSPLHRAANGNDHSDGNDVGNKETAPLESKFALGPSDLPSQRMHFDEKSGASLAAILKNRYNKKIILPDEWRTFQKCEKDTATEPALETSKADDKSETHGHSNDESSRSSPFEQVD